MNGIYVLSKIESFVVFQRPRRKGVVDVTATAEEAPPIAR
jgi:hypothetical protein